MRLLAVALSVLALSSFAEAKGKAKRPAKHESHATKKKRSARARHRIIIHTPIKGQSVGAPWSGKLRDAAALPAGEGYVIRRPWRRYGTRTTVDYVLRVISDIRDEFPDAHVLAIGDISAEHGGKITQHHSHQTGRDVDIGLIYKHKPPGYPASFIPATEENLDCEATYALLAGFVATHDDPAGAQVIFLDYDVQRLLYEWAKEHDVSEKILDRTFQYPHGRGSSAGIVHHEPNHDNHIHVRFRCPRGDTACR
jgi:hypothetical protein